MGRQYSFEPSHPLRPVKSFLGVPSDLCEVVSIQLIERSLVVVLANGVVMSVAKMPIKVICSLAATQPETLDAAIRKLAFLKCTLPVALPIKKALAYGSDGGSSGSFQVVVVDAFDNVLVGDIGDLTGFHCSAMSDILSATATDAGGSMPKCIDMSLLPRINDALPAAVAADEGKARQSLNLVIAVYDDHKIRVFDGNSKSCSLVVPLSTPVKSIALLAVQSNEGRCQFSHMCYTVAVTTRTGVDVYLLLRQSQSCSNPEQGPIMASINLSSETFNCLQSSRSITSYDLIPGVFCNAMVGLDVYIRRVGKYFIGYSISPLIEAVGASVLTGYINEQQDSVALSSFVPPSAVISSLDLLFQLIGNVISFTRREQDREKSSGVCEALIDLISECSNNGVTHILLNAVLTISNPPRGFVARIVRAAKVRVILSSAY
jgi:hypothetical protein